MEDDGSNSGRPYLLAVLRHLATDTTLLLSTMHMKAKMAQDMEDLRARQIRQLLDVVQERAAAKADAVLITGDFNTDPYDAPKQTARCVPAVLDPPALLHRQRRHEGKGRGRR